MVRTVCDPDYLVQVASKPVGYRAWSGPIAGSDEVQGDLQVARNGIASIQGTSDPMSLEVATRGARHHIPDPGSERDSWIAATALVHDLTIVTRNVADFARTSVSLVNPWVSGG